MPSQPHPEPAIRGICFDFGNVICTFDNRRILAALSPVCGHSPAELERLISGSDLPGAYESGAITSQDFLEGMSSLCGRPFSEAVFVPAFTDIFSPIRATFELIKHLKPHYRLGLISNTNPWHAEHAIRTAEVFPLFDAVSLSHEVRAMKPDPRIFLDALGKLGLPPEACVFIDDIPAFVEGATALGMHGIVYAGPEMLRQELHALGVEP